VGAAVVTAGGGDLPAQFVIHAVIRARRTGDARQRRPRLAVDVASGAGVAVRAPQRAAPRTGAGNLTLEDSAEIMATVLHLTKAAPIPGGRVVRRGALRDQQVSSGAAPGGRVNRRRWVIAILTAWALSLAGS